MRTVSVTTRSQSIENPSNGEKAVKVKATDAQKSRNPLSDISNQVFERLTRPTQKSVKQGTAGANESVALLIPQQQERQSKDAKESHIVIEPETVEEMEFDEDGKKINKRRISTRVLSLRQHKKRKSEEMVIIAAEESCGIEIESPKKLNWIDIDAEDHNDPVMVSEYVNDIYAYLRSLEKSTLMNPRYLAHHEEVTEKMRAILIDWTVEVHQMFKLIPETLFLTWAIIDHYLEKHPDATKDKLQLIGVTSMLIASKYEEIYAPEVADFVYITDGAYCRETILDMEEDVLAALDFSVNFVSPLHFLRRFSKAAESDYTIHTLCKYLIELCALDVRLLRYLPSEIAAGATYLARAMTHQIPIWSSTLEHYSTYTEAHAREIAIDINKLLKRVPKSTLKNIPAKYASPKFGEVANYQLINDL